MYSSDGFAKYLGTIRKCRYIHARTISIITGATIGSTSNTFDAAWEIFQLQIIPFYSQLYLAPCQIVKMSLESQVSVAKDFCFSFPISVPFYFHHSFNVTMVINIPRTNYISLREKEGSSKKECSIFMTLTKLQAFRNLIWTRRSKVLARMKSHESFFFLSYTHSDRQCNIQLWYHGIRFCINNMENCSHYDIPHPEERCCVFCYVSDPSLLANWDYWYTIIL